MKENTYHGTLHFSQNNQMYTVNHNNQRHNYAGAGYSWDGTGFASPEPYPSWTLDATYRWQPPTPYPDDGKDYLWDEDTTSWVEIAE